MPRPDGTLTPKEWVALPECKGCGMKRAFHTGPNGECTRCRAVELPRINQRTDHIFGLLTERLVPNPLVWEK